MLPFVKLLVTFSISMYIMCVTLCLFSVLSRGVGASHISIIIIIFTPISDRLRFAIKAEQPQERRYPFLPV